MAGKKRDLKDFAQNEVCDVQTISTTKMRCVKPCRCAKHIVEETTFKFSENGKDYKMYGCTKCKGFFVEDEEKEDKPAKPGASKSAVRAAS